MPSPKYSVIVPVYNRPREVDELLESLTRQTYTDFEVLIIEDGSAETCEEVVKKYEDKLTTRYYFKENSGQGFSRNYGFERASGEYFIVFDSDCLIPESYFESLEQHLRDHPCDAFGGPDKAMDSFTIVQRAINYSMTSFLSTGGIRGNKRRIGQFHPRSFNMGISKEVFAKTGGYILPKMGEDIEFSIRIIKNGFKVDLVPDAFVFHKRRTSLGAFFRQLHFFGRARINVGRYFPGEVKLVHAFPALFTLFLLAVAISPAVSIPVFWFLGSLLGLYIVLLFFHSLATTNSIFVPVISIFAVLVQLTGYGTGFIREGLKRLFKG